ncbi:hypothetical protein Aperf_G00000080653 [Anoplocephala perfoliata]
MQAERSSGKTMQRPPRSSSTYKPSEKYKRVNPSTKKKPDSIPSTQSNFKHNRSGKGAFPSSTKSSDKTSAVRRDKPKVQEKFTDKHSGQQHTRSWSQSSAGKKESSDIVENANLVVDTVNKEPPCSISDCVKPFPEATRLEFVDLKPDCDVLLSSSSLEEEKYDKFDEPLVSKPEDHPRISHTKLPNVNEAVEGTMNTICDNKLEVFVCNFDKTTVRTRDPCNLSGNHSIAESLNNKLKSLIRKPQRERARDLFRFIELGLDDFREIFDLQPMDKRSCYLWKFCHTELCHAQNQTMDDCFSREIQTDKPQMAPYSSWTQIPPSFNGGDSGHVWFACRFNST